MVTHVPTAIPTAYGDDDDDSASIYDLGWPDVWSMLVTSGIVCAVLLSLGGQLVSRKSLWQLIYCPRLGWERAMAMKSAKHGGSYRPLERPYRRSGRIVRDLLNLLIYGVDDTLLLQQVGLEQYLYLRFLRLCAKIATWGTVLACGAGIPAYATTGHHKKTLQWSRFTMANLSAENSGRLWVPVGIMGILTCVIADLVLREARLFCRLRQKWLSQTEMNAPIDPLRNEQRMRTVMLERLPPSLRTNDQLYAFFDSVLPNKVHSAQVAYKTAELESLVQERNEMASKLHRLLLAQEKNNDNAPPKVGSTSDEMVCCGLIEPSSCCLETGAPPKGRPAIPWRRRQLADLHQGCLAQREALLNLGKQAEDYQAKGVMLNGGILIHSAIIDTNNDDDDDASSQAAAEQNNKAFSDTGFVTFHDMATAAAVNTMQILPVPESVQAHGTPPDFDNLLWRNVPIPLDKRLARAPLAETFIYLIALLWSVWITACYSLAKYSTLEDLGLLPRLGTLPTIVQAVLSFIFSILPVALVSGVISLLPIFLQMFAENFEFVKFRSIVQLSVLKRNFFLQMVNLWLTIVAGSVLSALTAILEKPMSFAGFVGATLPSVAVYFVQMVLIKTYISLPLELSRLVPWLQLSSSRLASGGDVTKADAEPFLKPEFLYGSNYTTALMVIVILFLYAGISPLVSPFVAVYFIFAYFVYTHNALHVYISSYDDGGIFFFPTIAYLLGALIGSQLTLMGFLLVKEAYLQAIVMLLFPVATYVFSRTLVDRYDPVCNRVALSLVLKRDADAAAGAANISTGGFRLVDSFNPQLFRQPIFTSAETEPPALASNGDDATDNSHLYYQYIDDGDDMPSVKPHYGDDTPLLAKDTKAF